MVSTHSEKEAGLMDDYIYGSHVFLYVQPKIPA